MLTIAGGILLALFLLFLFFVFLAFITDEDVHGGLKAAVTIIGVLVILVIILL